MASKKRKSGDEDIHCTAGDEDGEAEVKEEDDEAEEDFDALLESLPREQLISLLRAAAASHPPTLAEVRHAGDIDPVHRKLFVYGLGWDTTCAGLRAAFAPFGEIEDCRVVSDRSSGRSKGYGFVLFRRRCSARAALRSPEKIIDGRSTTCQLASVGAPAHHHPIHNDPNPIHTPNSYPSHHDGNLARKIYVSRVTSDIDGSRLRDFFAKYGEIEEGPIGFDRQTGKPRGFALFVYKTPEGARRALEEPSKDFEGYTLLCQRAADNKNRNATAFANTPASSYVPLPNMADQGYNPPHDMSMIGQGFTGLGGMHPFTQPDVQPNAALLAMLAAAGQSIAPAVIASMNPALAAAAFGAGPQVAPQTVGVPSLSVQGYSMGNAVGFPQNVAFQAHQHGTQGPPYQGGLLGQNVPQKPPVTQMGGCFGPY